jgi:hypothetical protein
MLLRTTGVTKCHGRCRLSMRYRCLSRGQDWGNFYIEAQKAQLFSHQEKIGTKAKLWCTQVRSLLRSKPWTSKTNPHRYRFSATVKSFRQVWRNNWRIANKFPQNLILAIFTIVLQHNPVFVKISQWWRTFHTKTYLCFLVHPTYHSLHSYRNENFRWRAAQKNAKHTLDIYTRLP